MLCMRRSQVGLAVARAPSTRKSLGPSRARTFTRKSVSSREYFVQEFRSGFCLPSFARKRSGGVLPGQIKAWTIGRPLPSSLTVCALPRQWVVKIGSATVRSQIRRRRLTHLFDHDGNKPGGRRNRRPKTNVRLAYWHEMCSFIGGAVAGIRP